jgi:hypothetical protein
MEHVETPNVSDGEFTWTLRHFGIVLEDEAAVLHSPEFAVGGDVDANGNEPSRWRLDAWCGRACPNSAVRVNVRLVNLNNFALRGRSVQKAKFQLAYLKICILRNDASNVAVSVERIIKLIIRFKYYNCLLVNIKMISP